MRRLALGAGLYLTVCGAGGIYVVDEALHRPRVRLAAEDVRRAEDVAASLDARLGTVSITARDGALLSGWMLTPSRPNGDGVLLLHGIVSTRAGTLDTSRMFVERGYRALVVDQRANGESDGDLTTFGVREADDARRWLARLGEESTDGCRYVYGVSLGAAVAMLAADAPGVCGAVADSGYSSLRDVAYDRLGQRAHVPRWIGQTVLRPAVEIGFAYARARHGVDLGNASPIDAVAGPGAPIFVIHGQDDDNSPPENAERLAAANPDRVTLWRVPGAGHGVARRVARDEYHARVGEFLRTHQTPER